MPDLFALDGQVALVVGAAAGGLGEQAAVALRGQGAAVAVADQSSRASDLATTASASGATSHLVDVTDESSVAALIDDVVDAHGRMDIVVNAAGLMLRRPYDETSLEEFEDVIRVNLIGTWLVGRAAGVRMTVAASRGRIVNISTVYAERVGPMPESAYYASKSGVANLTRALAAELGPHGINVNCLAPGIFYPTKMTAPLSDNPERLAWFSARTILGRLGDPEADFAGPLLFLSSRASRYVTGQILYVDGGWTAW